MKLTRWNHPVAGQTRPVIDWSRGQIDPYIPIFSGPDSPRTSSERRGGISQTVIVSVGFGLRAQIEQIDVKPMDGFLFFEVLFDDLVNGGVRDGEGVWGSEGGRRG